MSYGEIKSAMQQGVIDGAENNITALFDHADVTKYYIYDEHAIDFDVIVISAETWNRLTTEQQEILRNTAANMAANNQDMVSQFESFAKVHIASVNGR